MRKLFAKGGNVLIDEFFPGVKAGKVVVLDDADFKGESAEVTGGWQTRRASSDIEVSVITTLVVYRKGFGKITKTLFCLNLDTLRVQCKRR